ncbi:MAG TPA: hypothetical protein PKK10_00610 [Woeseiaceae bacterium]|nr:hypothetical protein [Woeseiaceae bacterium]
MDLDTLSKLGEFVGGFFVVISLIYLAYQVRQNTRSLRAENYGRVLDRMSALQSATSADAELNRVFTIGAESPGRLTRSERIRFTWALYELLGNAEFMYHQSRDGTLPPAVWERWKNTLGWWMSHPGMRAWWVSKPTPFTEDFTGFVDTLIRDDSYDAAAVGRWRQFVAGEEGSSRDNNEQHSS